jgi:hypothetical protein
MATHAIGTFEVMLLPQTPEDKAEDSILARMSIDKQFHGYLEATSKGQMLTAATDVLQHSSTLTRGTPQQSITVVLDSGTGQLAGLTGKMTINIADGKHSYGFNYTLPESH